MAVGKRSAQISMFEPQFWWHNMLTPDSFYARMAHFRDYLVSDEELADLYKSKTRGNVSIPPSLVCLVLLLMYYEDVSDVEAAERMKYDLRWKLALGVPLDWPGFDRTVLVKFRARLLAANKERVIFDRTIRVAREAGLVARGERQLLDSTNTIGQAAVMDTYQLLRTGIRKLLKQSGFGAKSAQAALSPHLESYLQNAKTELNWHDETARLAHLQQLVTDAKAVVSLSKSVLAGLDEETQTELAATVALVEKIMADDLEEVVLPTNPTQGQAPHHQSRLREGSAKDRVVSTRDPSLRHGRKGASKSWKGHKIQLAMAPEEEII